MGTQIATTTDLSTYLGVEVDPIRADLILRLAQELCETVVSPAPASALGVILEVAGRAYSNVNSATQLGMGSAYASFGQAGSGGVGGLYLSRANKATLRRMSGSGGAFSVDPTPVDAGEGLPVWDQNATFLTGIPIFEDRS